MKRLIVLAVVVLCSSGWVYAQEADTTSVVQTAPPSKPATTKASKIYFGGTVGLNFGDYFRIRVAPMVGYKLTPKASAGVKVAYEYVEDDRITRRSRRAITAVVCLPGTGFIRERTRTPSTRE